MSILSIGIIVFFLLSCILLVGQRRTIIKYFVALLVGFSICLLPWLILQQLAFGKASFVVDRVGQYNFFVGNDIDELGWLSIPYPDLRSIEHEKYSDILKHAFNKSPERFAKLFLDKPARLLKLPWNDFRAKIGPVPLYAQTLFHQLILVLAAIGVITSFSTHHRNIQKPQILARLVILFVGLFHLIYLLFITVPRYGLTAMPEIIIFSAVGLSSIFIALKEKSSRRSALKIIVATTALLLSSQLNMLPVLATINDGAIAINFWLFINIAFRIAISGMFLVACWQLAVQYACAAKRSYALICICLIAFFAAPAYCLPIRANGRWFEWSKNFQKRGVKSREL